VAVWYRRNKNVEGAADGGSRDEEVLVVKMSQSGTKWGQDLEKAQVSRTGFSAHPSNVCEKPSWNSNYGGNVPEPSNNYAAKQRPFP